MTVTLLLSRELLFNVLSGAWLAHVHSLWLPGLFWNLFRISCLNKSDEFSSPNLLSVQTWGFVMGKWLPNVSRRFLCMAGGESCAGRINSEPVGTFPTAQLCPKGSQTSRAVSCWDGTSLNHSPAAAEGGPGTQSSLLLFHHGKS